jgi:hypothetical protein
MQGFVSIYDEVYRTCKNKKMLLRDFQTALENIPQWNDMILENEFKRFERVSDCDWLEKLIHTAIVTTAAKLCQGAIRSELLPKGHSFVHKCYVHAAREFWRKPMMFYAGHRGKERHRYMQEARDVMKRSIMATIREHIPYKDIACEILERGKYVAKPHSTENIERLASTLKQQLHMDTIDQDATEHVSANHEDSHEVTSNASNEKVEALPTDEPSHTHHDEEEEPEAEASPTDEPSHTHHDEEEPEAEAPPTDEPSHTHHDEEEPEAEASPTDEPSHIHHHDEEEPEAEAPPTDEPSHTHQDEEEPEAEAPPTDEPSHTRDEEAPVTPDKDEKETTVVSDNHNETIGFEDSDIEFDIDIETEPPQSAASATRSIVIKGKKAHSSKIRQLLGVNIASDSFKNEAIRKKMKRNLLRQSGMYGTATSRFDG